MVDTRPAPQRFDSPTLEIIIVAILTTLHDFLLSDVLSLPLALRRGTLGQLRSFDQLVSNLEFAVPGAIFVIMVILWLLARNAWVRRVAMVFLAWVTLRLIAKIALILSIIVSRPQTGVGMLLRDTIVLWLVIFVLFGVWYWVIDGGGPDARRDRSAGATTSISRSAPLLFRVGRVGSPACGITYSWASAAVPSSA